MGINMVKGKIQTFHFVFQGPFAIPGCVVMMWYCFFSLTVKKIQATTQNSPAEFKWTIQFFQQLLKVASSAGTG